MKIQVASKDIAEGEILFPSPNISYMEANTQKNEETYIYAPERTHGRPDHAFYAHSCPLSIAIVPRALLKTGQN